MEMRWFSFCDPFGHGTWVTLCWLFQPAGTSSSLFLHTPHCFQGLVVVWEDSFLCIWSQKQLWELQASNEASSKFCSTTFTLLRKHSRACWIFVWLILAVDRKQAFRLKTFTYLCIDNTNMNSASAWGMRGSACVYSLSRLLQQTKAQGLAKIMHTHKTVMWWMRILLGISNVFFSFCAFWLHRQNMFAGFVCPS